MWIDALCHRATKESGMPVIGVTETEPPGQNYQNWILCELAALETGPPTKQP